jgi:hypothetical protein
MTVPPRGVRIVGRRLIALAVSLTNRLIRETFATAGHPAAEHLVLFRSGT